MSVAVSLASKDALLKRYYPEGAQIPADLVDEVEGEFGKLLELDTDYQFGGKLKAMVPTEYTMVTGGSHDYKTSYKNSTPSDSDDYDVPAKDEFQHIFVDGKYIRAAKANPALRYESNIETLNDSRRAIKACHKRIRGWKPWGDEGGSIARLKSTVTLGSTNGEFVNRVNINRIERGMYLQAGPNLNGTSVRTGRVQVKTVNRKKGTFTIDVNWNSGIPAIVASDYLFIEGDAAKGWAGWQTWVPFKHADVGTLYGVDRTQEIDRQAGMRIPMEATAKPFSYLTELMKWVIEQGKMTEIAFTTTRELARLQLDLRSHQYGVDVKTIGFGGGVEVMFPTSGRSIKVIGDRYLAPVHMPEDAPLYCATSKRAWKRLMVGELAWLEEDGRRFRYVEGEDVLQAGYGGNGNFICVRTDECFVVGDSTYVTDA